MSGLETKLVIDRGKKLQPQAQIDSRSQEGRSLEKLFVRRRQDGDVIRKVADWIEQCGDLNARHTLTDA